MICKTCRDTKKVKWRMYISLGRYHICYINCPNPVHDLLPKERVGECMQWEYDFYHALESLNAPGNAQQQVQADPASSQDSLT